MKRDEDSAVNPGRQMLTRHLSGPSRADFTRAPQMKRVFPLHPLQRKPLVATDFQKKRKTQVHGNRVWRRQATRQQRWFVPSPLLAKGASWLSRPGSASRPVKCRPYLSKSPDWIQRHKMNLKTSLHRCLWTPIIYIFRIPGARCCQRSLMILKISNRK